VRMIYASREWSHRSCIIEGRKLKEWGRLQLELRVFWVCQIVHGTIPFAGYPCERVGRKVEETTDCMNTSGA
jgi:hypothetical protein